MRIRTIKPEFYRSEQVASVSPLARILFHGLWAMADRRGRLEDRPLRIKIEVLPYDDVDIDSELHNLQSAGLIIRYSRAGVKVIQVLNFEKHQRITGKESETESELPEYNGETLGKQPGNIGEATETTGREGKGKEGKVKEGNGVSSEQSGKPDSSKPTSRKHLPEDQFLAELERHYPDTDVSGELRKMDAWLLTKPGRKKTRGFIVNWLNKIDPGVKATSVEPQRFSY